MSQPDEQRQQWIEDYCNGLINGDEFHQFEKALREDPVLRRELRQYLALDQQLRNESESGLALSEAWNEQEQVEQAPLVSFPVTRILLAIAACLIVALLLRAPVAPPSATAMNKKVEPAAQGYGVFTSDEKAVWASHPELEKGDLIPAGPIELKSGIAQVELFSGVTLVAEGETRLEVLSPMEVILHSGRVRARVPEPAKGFVLRSSAGRILDLGTEFAVEVTGDHSEIHVLEGEIEWQGRDQEKTTHMTQGDAIRTDGQGTETRVMTKNEFAGISSLQGRPSSRREQWLEYSRSLGRDPRVVAYYPMSQGGEWKRQLFNEARQSQLATDGAIVAAQRSADRFGEPRGALDFSPTGSRVRLQVNQELRSLTFLAWVKIDSLDRWYNSLFLTDGHELHEPHWQIMDDGRLFFSIRAHTRESRPPGSHGDKHVVYSPPFWTPALSGKWTQIATTFDQPSQTVSHYINGRLFHRETLPEIMQVASVHIGPATLGNWSDPSRNDPHFSVRNLNGSIDEFIIFSEALDAAEITDLYDVGKP